MGGMINMVNVVLCAVILVLGFMGYNKTKEKMLINIGIAFGIFGVSHLIALAGYGMALAGILLVLRIIAYLLVASSMYKAAVKK